MSKTKYIEKRSEKIKFLKKFVSYKNFSDVNIWFDADGNKEESFKRILTLTRDNEKHFLTLFGKPLFTLNSNGKLKVWEVIFENNPVKLILTSSSRGSEYMFSPDDSTSQERQEALQKIFELLHEQEPSWEPPTEN